MEMQTNRFAEVQDSVDNGGGNGRECEAIRYRERGGEEEGAVRLVSLQVERRVRVEDTGKIVCLH